MVSMDRSGLDCLHLVLSSVIDAASLRSLPHHFSASVARVWSYKNLIMTIIIKMSPIYLRAGRAGRAGRRSPSTIPNNNVFNSRLSGILQICPNSWAFTVSFRYIQLLVSLH